MTSTTQQLADAMAHHAITVETEPRGVETTLGWQHYAYHFHLDVNGERLISSGSYSAGMARPDVEPVDVFGSILMDCQSVEPYANSDEDEAKNVYPQTRAAFPPGFDQWADDLGLLQHDSTDKRTMGARVCAAAGDFRDIMNRRALLRDRLGADAYAALLDIAAEL